jgi:hypothetical protein
MVVRKNSGIRTKPPSYKEAIAWIANNDEPDETDKEVLVGFISVCLVADLFHKTTDQVAEDVVGFKIR